jgi:hypothetical protein
MQYFGWPVTSRGQSREPRSPWTWALPASDVISLSMVVVQLHESDDRPIVRHSPVAAQFVGFGRC